MSGGRGPVVLSPLQNKEAGRVKINISLIKVVINLNKVKKEVKTLQEVISFFI